VFKLGVPLSKEVKEGFMRHLFLGKRTTIEYPPLIST
jgi:hypothetical protein